MDESVERGRDLLFMCVTFVGFLPSFTPPPGFLPMYPRTPVRRLQIEKPSGTRFEPATFPSTVICPTTLGLDAREHQGRAEGGQIAQGVNAH
jgi:hypothetical protein